tara:strand:- start:396 stop:647 length:252 start_codon:yes stop_codon:yes gene_type:complete
MLEPTEWAEFNFEPIKIGEHRAFVTRWDGRGSSYFSVYVCETNSWDGNEYTLIDVADLDEHPSEDKIAEMIADELEARFDESL